MLNSIILEGRLTKDLTYINTPNYNQEGQDIAVKFSIAQDYRKDKVLFFECVYFGKKGLFPWVKKGSAVIIQGKFEYDEVEKDGQKKKYYYIRVVDLAFSMSNCGNNKKETTSSSWGQPNTNNQNNYNQATEGQKMQNTSNNSNDGFNDDEFIPF